MAVHFLDDQGVLIPPPYPGFSQSDTFPGYRYVSTRSGEGRIALPISGPESAQTLQISVYPWRQTDIVCDALDVTVAGPTLASQRQALAEAMRRFRANIEGNGRPPVLIRTMAALGHGFSRPACLAEAFRKLGRPVVLVGPDPLEEGAALPFSDDGGLLKLPDAYLAERFDDWLLTLPPGLFLQSACDQSGIHFQLVLRAAGWHCVQDLHDDWEARAVQGLAPGHSTVFERQLCEGSDLVVAGTGLLAQRISDLNDGVSVQLVSNGAWADELPESVADPDGPVGYFGSLAHKDFDWALLCSLAARRPDLLFELHGCGAPSAMDLPENVRVIETHSVPDAVETAHWRGALLLLSPASPSANVSPIQLQEYQKRGLPVLCNVQCDIVAGPGTTLCEDEVEAARLMDGWLETARGVSPAWRTSVPSWQDTAQAFLEV